MYESLFEKSLTIEHSKQYLERIDLCATHSMRFTFPLFFFTLPQEGI